MSDLRANEGPRVSWNLHLHTGSEVLQLVCVLCALPLHLRTVSHCIPRDCAWVLESVREDRGSTGSSHRWAPQERVHVHLREFERDLRIDYVAAEGNERDNDG